MKVFILGAGATGGLLAQLLRRRRHTVWCGDRDPARARPFIGRAIECRPVNARSIRSVVHAVSLNGVLRSLIQSGIAGSSNVYLRV